MKRWVLGMSVRSVSPDEFVAEIAATVRNEGMGFVPLVGSGVSAQSGIPTTAELAGYLRYCVCLAVDTSRRWRPGEDMWPSAGQAVTVKALEQAFDKADEDLVSRMRQGLRQTIHLEEKITPLARPRSMTDWYELLLYLSCWDADERKLLRFSNEAVFDTFGVHFTSGRFPNMAHRMIAHLLPLLGSGLILTTNFDNLLEEACHEARLRCRVFNIPRNGDLPRHNITTEHPAIIKLHGSNVGLSFGSHCDRPASLADQEAFTSYFGVGPESSGSERRESLHNLLVLGFSGADHRIVSLIRHYLRSARTRVFWLCYCRQDELTVHRLFEKEHPNSVYVARMQNVGLALLQIYQGISFNVPPAGVFFPAITHLPYPPKRTDSSTPELSRRFWDKLAKLKDKACFETKNICNAQKVWEDPRFVHLRSAGNPGRKSGLTSLCAELYDQLYEDFQCVWLDVDDVVDEADFFLTLCHLLGASICKKPTILRGERRERKNLSELAKEDLGGVLKKALEGSDRPILLFVNARYGYGTCVSCKWDDVSKKALLDGIRGVLSEHLNLKVVWMHEGDCVTGSNDAKGEVSYILDSSVVHVHPQALFDDLAEEGSADEAESRGLRLFMYALSKFRRAVHFAALSSKAFHEEEASDTNRTEDVVAYLEHLDKYGLVRRKVGGFVWVQTAAKLKLRDWYDEKNLSFDLKKQVLVGIADWYQKLLYSSGDAFAVIEAIVFRIEVAKLVVRARAKDLKDDKEWSKELAEAGIGACIQIVAVVRHGRGRILGHYAAHKFDKLLERARQEFEELLKDVEQAANVSSVTAKSAINHFVCVGRSAIETLDSISLDLARQASDEPATEKAQGRVDDRSHEASLPYTDAWTSSDNERWKPVAQSENSAYEKLVQALAFRHYEQAVKTVEQLLKNYGIDSRSEFLTFAPDGKKIEAKSILAQRCPLEVNQGSLRDELKVLRRGMQLNLDVVHILDALRACMEGNHDAFEGDLRARLQPNEIGEEKSVEDLMEDIREGALRDAENLYLISRQVRRMVITSGNSGFLLRESSRMRSLMAKILAKQGHFHGAQRRLNESVSCLAASPGRSEDTWWAELNIRRADVILENAEAELSSMHSETNFPGQKKENLVKLKSSIGRLAVVCNILCWVEKDLEASRSDVYWWCYALEVRMRAALAYAEIQERDESKLVRHPSTLRRSLHRDELGDRLARAVYLADSDKFRLARLLFLTSRLNDKRSAAPGASSLECEQLLEQLKFYDGVHKGHSNNADYILWVYIQAVLGQNSVKVTLT